MMTSVSGAPCAISIRDRRFFLSRVLEAQTEVYSARHDDAGSGKQKRQIEV